MPGQGDELEAKDKGENRVKDNFKICSLEAKKIQKIRFVGSRKEWGQFRPTEFKVPRGHLKHGIYQEAVYTGGS